MTDQELREILAEEFAREGLSEGFCTMVRKGTDNSSGGCAAIRAMRRLSALYEERLEKDTAEGGLND